MKSYEITISNSKYATIEWPDAEWEVYISPRYVALYHLSCSGEKGGPHISDRNLVCTGCGHSPPEDAINIYLSNKFLIHEG